MLEAITFTRQHDQLVYMALNLADRSLIRSIFFLNVPPPATDNYDEYFAWENPGKDHNWSKYLYIKDESGRVKWIFSEKNSYPIFLSLENRLQMTSTLKQKFIRGSFCLGIKKWITSGSFYVNEDQVIPLFDLMNTVPHESFTILTNTTGKYRKSVIALNQGKYISHFIKLAHTDLATELIYNEVYGLQILSQRRLRRIVHPFLSHTEGDHAIIISSVKPIKRGYRSMSLEPVHIQALEEMYQLFHHERELQDILYYVNLESELAEIKNLLQEPEISLSNEQLDSLASLLDMYSAFQASISPRILLTVSLTHGDFIPSNMYLTARQLNLYDWEYMQESLPLLFDMFYFVYHTYMLNPTPLTPESVKGNIEALLDQKEIRKLCMTYNIDAHYYHKLYLLLDTPRMLNVLIRTPEAKSSYTLKHTIQLISMMLSTVSEYEPPM